MHIYETRICMYAKAKRYSTENTVKYYFIVDIALNDKNNYTCNIYETDIVCKVQYECASNSVKNKKINAQNKL